MWIKNASYETPPIPKFLLHNNDNYSLPSPVDYFKRYITNDIISEMVNMSNLYAARENINFLATNTSEITVFIGIHLLMGNLGFPRISMYWNKQLGISLVNENMTLNRFYKLRNTFHLEDTDKKTKQQ